MTATPASDSPKATSARQPIGSRNSSHEATRISIGMIDCISTALVAVVVLSA